MKKLFLLFSLITVHCSLFAQTWLWAKGTTNVNYNTWGGDPLAIAVDSTGNVFGAGVLGGDVQFGAYTVNTNGEVYDGYLAKYDPTGNVMWATAPVVSSYSQCVAWDVAADGAGNAYVTGYYWDTATFGSYMLTGQAYSSSLENGNAYLAKYDASGNVVWALASVQPSPASYANSETVTVDNKGNIYIAGYYKDTITFGSFTLTTADTNNAGIFVVKYSSSGVVTWVKGGEITNTSFNIGTIQPTVRVDANDNIYLAGGFVNTMTFGSLTFNTNPNGDFFLMKLNSSGSVQWGKCGVATGNSSVPYNFFGKIPCTIDRTGNIYVAGSFMDSLQVGPYNLDCKNSGSNAIFFAKYNPSGSVLWAEKSTEVTTFFAQFSVYSLSADKWNNIYFSGNYGDSMTFAGITLPTFAPFTFPSFLLKIDTSGNALCGSAINNENDDNNAVVADPLGQDAYFTGDADYDSCAFGSQMLYGTDEWAFMAKWACDSNKCTLVASLNGTKNICQGSSDVLSASGGSSYLWSNGATSQTITVSPSANTEYSVIVSNGSCSATDSIHITVHPGPVVTLCCDTTISPGQSVPLDATGGVSYSWSPDNGLSCNNCPDPIASPSQTTTYYVTINTDSGCSVTDAVTIDINCGQVFIPTAFSPNNDGQNDILYVRGDCINTMDFIVFDRWGNKVFESQNKSDGWDGTYKGKAMNTGTYVWYLKATLDDGSLVKKKGNVALVR